MLFKTLPRSKSQLLLIFKKMRSTIIPWKMDWNSILILGHVSTAHLRTFYQCRESQAKTQVVFQAKTQEKKISIELPPCIFIDHWTPHTRSPTFSRWQSGPVAKTTPAYSQPPTNGLSSLGVGKWAHHPPAAVSCTDGPTELNSGNWSILYADRYLFRHLSNSIWNTSTSGVKSSWTSL